MSYVTRADLGGQGGHGAVVPEPEGELFHAAWEPRALALTLAMGATGSWNIDSARAARETLPDYADLSYYEIWLGALEKLLALHGLATAGELAAGRASHPPVAVARVLKADQVAAVLARGSPTGRAAAGPPLFNIGQAVRTHTQAADHHTRLPGYLRGKTGRIDRVLGAHVFADAHARGLGEDPRWLYTVVFDAAELWGAGATPRHRVSFDAWEPYLLAA